MRPKIAYEQLRAQLQRLGWTAEPLELDAVGGTLKTRNTLFRHPKTDLYIVLPYTTPGTTVEPIHLLRVRNVLENAGFWDSLARQTGAGSQEETVQVLQTLAGIKS